MIPNGSPKAVAASSNETSCLFRFVAAFRGFHSNSNADSTPWLRVVVAASRILTVVWKGLHDAYRLHAHAYDLTDQADDVGIVFAIRVGLACDLTLPRPFSRASG